MYNSYEIHKCPFCGSSGCYKEFDSASNAIFYECSHFAGGCEHRLKAKLGSSIEDCPDTKKKIKLYNLVYEHCLKHTGIGDESIWWYGCSENPIEGNDISKHRIYISSAGYAISIIDEKEHNNQIVPEIFYEIDSSSFLVMDVTYPNYGAYYEAGYALGTDNPSALHTKTNELKHFAWPLNISDDKYGAMFALGNKEVMDGSRLRITVNGHQTQR